MEITIDGYAKDFLEMIDEETLREIKAVTAPREKALAEKLRQRRRERNDRLCAE